MKYYLYSALLLLSALGSPVGAQMLLDAATGSAVQVLQDAQSLRNVSSQSPLTPGEVQPTWQAPKPTATKNAAPLQMLGSEILFSVNGHGIQLCSSGLPCFWQLRRSMGLN
ncbi:hypothetical protein [Synechococcus lacustris]|uniref:hypothetical protein n=1 Tax=Synechococcus lacustris TaxID=2116544 RepID=UPI0033429212